MTPAAHRAGEHSGRVALVTGGTGGIGRAVALQLAQGGDRVIFVGRDPQRGQNVLAALRAAHPGAEHVFIPADLSLLRETARVADRIARTTDRLDAAVFCAGILSTVPEWTSEHLERNFVLNYLTRYLLARRLLPVLMHSLSGRIVLVSNAGKYGDSLDFDDLQHHRGRPGMKVAGRTQFANDLFAVELAARLRGTRVEATCVYPGIVRTDVFTNSIGLPWLVRAAAQGLQRLIAITPAAAAETPVFLAQSPQAVGTGGRFYGPACEQRNVPPRVRRPERSSRFWAASEALVRPYLTETYAPHELRRERAA